MSAAQDALVAQATDPHAALETLHELAQNYPGLRRYIAANPRTYPALLEWLASLNDPDINAALASRDVPYGPLAGTAAQPPSQSGTTGDAGHAGAAAATSVLPTASTPSIATEGAPAASGAVVPGAQAQDATVALSATGASNSATGAAAGTPQGSAVSGAAAQAASILPGTAALSSAGEALELPTEDDSAREKKSPVLFILAGITVLLLAFVGTWAIMGGSEPERGSAAPQTSAPAEAATQPAATPGEPSPAATEEVTPSPSPSPTAETQAVAPAPEGALVGTSFSAPSGNISCSLDDNVAQCTILAYSFQPATESCTTPGEALTVMVTEDGVVDSSCGVSTPAGAALGYGQAMTNETFACTSDESGVSCWSTATGDGFSLARQDAVVIERTH